MLQTWEQLLNFPQPTADGTALASSTTLTDISVAPQYTLPANFLQPGQTFRLKASGRFSNTGTPTLLLGFYVGGVAGTAIAASGATTTTTGATNWQWRMEAMFTVRAIGTSGTIMPWGGLLQLGTSATAFTSIPIPSANPATVTVDTTAAKAFTVGAQWGTSNASNTTQLIGFTIESVG